MPGQTAMFFMIAPASAEPVAIVIPQQKMVASCPGDPQAAPMYGLVPMKDEHMGMLAG
jgi:hypothetical protein